MNYSKETGLLAYEDIHPANFTVAGDEEVAHKTEQLKKEILGFSDTVLNCSGEVYYISSNGDDNNDGKTKETAWKTLGKIEENQTEFNENTTFLFERGCVFRGFFGVKSGRSYGAYGEGEKPVFIGSEKNYAVGTLWHKYGDDIWTFDAKDESGAPLWDIGLIAFDYGKSVGIKKNSLEELACDFDYFHDTENATLYLKYSAGNPADMAESIEICSRRHVLYGYNVHDISIENLCIRYTGGHGIGLSNVQNVSIKGCEIGWIGGSLQDPTVRFGNGIEIWNDCVNLDISYNWVYQCYDAGITHQGTVCTHRDIRIANNLIENCNYGLEFFVYEDSPIVENVLYEGNIIRASGYTWGNQRFNPWAQSAICCWHRKTKANNFVIKNNILEISRWYLVYLTSPSERGLDIVFDGNFYYQKKAQGAYAALWLDEEKLPANNQKVFEKSISQIDENYKVCKLLT